VHIASRRRRLVAALAVLASISCSDTPPEKVRVTSSKHVESTLRDGGRVKARLLRMARSYWSKGGFLSGLEPPRVVEVCYLDLDGEVRTSDGAVVALGWTSRDREALGPGANDPTVWVRPARMAVAGGDVFLEIALVPGTVVEEQLRGPPFEGIHTTLWRYVRLAGTRFHWPFLAPREPEYAWKPATREDFDRAAQVGGAIDVDDGANDPVPSPPRNVPR
jgi:hypothetical protein